MDNIDDLVQYCAPELPGASTGFIKSRLREAARRFCMETEAWTLKIYVDQVDGQANYDLHPAADAYVHRILWVKAKSDSSDNYDDVSVTSPTQYDLDADGFGFTFKNGYEKDYDITDGIEIKAALRPTMTADSFTGDLFDRYGEAIFTLTKSMVMGVPKKSYTDLNTADYYMRAYTRLKNTAIREKYTENKSKDMHVTQLGGIL